MPRVRVGFPKVEDAKAFPRAFAIYKQLANPGDADVEALALEEYMRHYGNPETEAPAAGASINFEEFASLFKCKDMPETPGEGNCLGYAARDPSGHIAPYRFTRRPTGPKDVRIQITHVGICHSDVHQVKNEWHNSTYPMVPGHEIVGYVTEVGSAVTKFKVGDRVGVGCMVNSCQRCDACLKQREEQFCPKAVWTYNGVEANGTTPTQGGYSSFVVVDDKFVLHIPENLPLNSAAPLLCAGITVYSPLRYYHLDQPGMKLGVAGLGGLGHMAVKIAAAMGVEVTVLSTSPSKRNEATKVLGAKHFLLTNDKEAMAAAANTLDGIINTVSADNFALEPFLSLLRPGGKLVCVGIPCKPPQMPTVPMVFKRLTIAGSVIGGIAETQEMLDFCGKHHLSPEVEVIKADAINEAYARMMKNDVRYRFVIDVQGSIISTP